MTTTRVIIEPHAGVLRYSNDPKAEPELFQGPCVISVPHDYVYTRPMSRHVYVSYSVSTVKFTIHGTCAFEVVNWKWVIESGCQMSAAPESLTAGWRKRLTGVMIAKLSTEMANFHDTLCVDGCRCAFRASQAVIDTTPFRSLYK